MREVSEFKIANNIGKVIMVVFGIVSVRWIAEMLGLFGMRFLIDGLPNVIGCIAIFIVGLIVTVSTK